MRCCQPTAKRTRAAASNTLSDWRSPSSTGYAAGQNKNVRNISAGPFAWPLHRIEWCTRCCCAGDLRVAIWLCQRAVAGRAPRFLVPEGNCFFCFLPNWSQCFLRSRSDLLFPQSGDCGIPGTGAVCLSAVVVTCPWASSLPACLRFHPRYSPLRGAPHDVDSRAAPLATGAGAWLGGRTARQVLPG